MFDHATTPLANGRHPEFAHLVLAEVEPYHGAYVMKLAGHVGELVLSVDDAEHIFSDRLDDGFAYVADDYVTAEFEPVRAPLGKRHSFLWTGTLPCTGVYACRHCGLETDAHPLDYSSVNYAEACPALD